MKNKWVKIYQALHCIKQLLCCCFCSVAQLCLTLCDLMDCSMPGFPFFKISWSVLKLIPLSQWCHPTILSSVVPFFSCPQFFPASGSFLMSWLFTSGGQSIGASALPSVLLMNIQDWFLLGLTGLISLQSKGLSRVFSNHSSKASVLQCSPFFMVQLSLEKP